MKKVGILGSGIVGRVLAAGFAQKGYEVMVGSRTPEKLSDWRSEQGQDIKTGNLSDTASFGEILVLAVKGSGAENALDLAGYANLKNKTIIDTCNPIADAPPEDGVISFFTAPDNSLLEILQKKFPGAHFVIAWNSIGNSSMVDPDFGSEKPTMFIAGDNDAAREEVTGILLEFGWEVQDMGTAKAARAIEPLCILWCIPGFRENLWTHAFRMVRK